MNKKFDIAIIGGGMVGATVAGCLGGSDLKVAVIEQRMPKAFAPEQARDLRVSALSIASQTVLASINAWPGVLSRRFCPFRRMRVWETTGNTEFNCQDINRPELGFIVENRVIQLALLDSLARFDNLELLAPASIDSIAYNPPQASVLTLADGSKISAKLLIAADGGDSRVRQRVNLGVNSCDYDQHALVLSIATAAAQQDITWQRFVPPGPQAFLPLSGNFGSLVWYNSPEQVSRLKALPRADLLQQLTAAFPSCLGTVEQILAVGSFPLKRQHAQHYVKDGVALVGDAAHIINPLAGQGVNIGLLDAAALAEVLVTAQTSGKDIAAAKTLAAYEKMRRNENLRMMLVMDAFYRVFSNEVLPLKFLRNAGLGLADSVLPVKNKVLRMAMGLDGKLPKLARGESLQ